MPKLQSPTHDVQALDRRLRELVPTSSHAMPREPASAASETSEVSVNVSPNRSSLIFSLRRLVSGTPIVGTLARRLRAFLNFRRQVISHLIRLDGQVSEGEARASSQHLHLEKLLRDANDRILALVDEQLRASRELRQLQATVRTLLRQSSAHGGQAASSANAAEAPREYADFYVGLEQLYRGDSAAIELRFEPYLSYVREALAGGEHDPVLDLGCGRGEWLSVLRREGINAIGIDSDFGMLEPARARGERVVQGDLLSFIEHSEPGSYGAVTAFQVVEHLPLDVLMRLFAAAARALRPGGLLVLETPNPENLQVSGYGFWLDPTRVRPLPPPLLDYFARYFGFCDMRIVRSNPWPAEQQFPENTPASRHLNKILFCEQDYALVARKPL